MRDLWQVCWSSKLSMLSDLIMVPPSFLATLVHCLDSNMSMNFLPDQCKNAFSGPVLQLVQCNLSVLWQAFTTHSVTKAMPIQFIDSKNYNYKETERPYNCCIWLLHMPFSWLAINVLRGGHTQTHTRTRYITFKDETISRKQIHAGLRPAYAWFKNILLQLQIT